VVLCLIGIGAGACRSAADGVLTLSTKKTSQTVSRDVEAPGEAAEMTVAEIDEQRQQEEARHQT
jgi:hypothetical protein